MYQPYTDELFIGSSLGGEFHRGATRRELRSNPAARIETSVLCSTDPNMFAAPETRACFERLSTRVRAVRFGGDCYTPCMVAAGATDLVVETSLKPWDIQPLIPIVEAAGGVISNWSGGPADRSDKVVIAANKQLHQQAIEAMDWSGD
jgi:myo-inositol-1(or 4)-monophosphatase